MHGKRSVLAVHDQQVLAKWTLKTVMLYDLFNPGRRAPGAYFSPSDYRRFYEHESLPSDSLIFIASYEAKHARVQARARKFPVIIGANAPAPLVADAYTATIGLGGILIQLFTMRRPEFLPAPVRVTPRAIWEVRTRPILPPMFAEIPWPFARPIREEEFDAYVARWSDLDPTP